MTPLGQRIAALIDEQGPISLETYWSMALYDRQGGYYMARMPFGREGDFITAPEISQMFGELLGAWMVAAWRGLGAPAPFIFAEIGPGRGTLMADMLRTARKLEPDFAKAARVHMIEVSDRLADVQMATLDRLDLPVSRVRALGELPEGPLLLVGNELFDALPIRQFIHDGSEWREQRIGRSQDGLAFVACPLDTEDAAWLTALPGLPPPSAGTILEMSPARTALAHSVARRLAAASGAALFIDYGHGGLAYGDTFQAISRHERADPLAEPGEADLTSHVEFGSLARAMQAGGLAVAPLANQGDFLLSLGLLERAGALGAGRSAAEQAAIVAAAERLAGSAAGQMGSIFKVLAAASRPLPLPPFIKTGAD
ncbi:class I SAM-dependent methyltransferase [Consotaella salsifontis]|uniref:SAM-dependent methyltransferase, MidA family n=1 Tax=Consotaella salsifontis TaxID=1365950 RepID=A0A1T4PUH7_9HYPH|nr:SAM-dependent methyltransferase [Consotaella salsifontis]SJZ95193.1 SAM-dependent methyltransferase, MidA family [Consotaella salsifontis]